MEKENPIVTESAEMPNLRFMDGKLQYRVKGTVYHDGRAYAAIDRWENVSEFFSE